MYLGIRSVQTCFSGVGEICSLLSAVWVSPEQLLNPQHFRPADPTIGDLIALSKLIYQIGLELKSVPESAPDYQDLLNELEALDRTLKQIYQIQPGVHELKRLDGVRALASTCQAPLQEFLAKIQKFNKALGPWSRRRHRFGGLDRPGDGWLRPMTTCAKSRYENE